MQTATFTNTPYSASEKSYSTMKSFSSKRSVIMELPGIKPLPTSDALITFPMVRREKE